MLEAKKPEFEKIIDAFKGELSKLRTARANPAMVEGVKVNFYDTLVAINTLGTISIPEPRQILIMPWDKNALQPIEKAIREAGLGLNPANEGDKIRITVPDLTEERRKELAKIVGKMAEESRIRLRNLREEIVKDLKKQEEAGSISEDAKFRSQEDLQKIVDEYNKKIKESAEAKEKEIMTI